MKQRTGANFACPIKRLFLKPPLPARLTFIENPPPSQVKVAGYRQRTFRTHACLTLQEASCRGQDQAGHNGLLTPSLYCSPSLQRGPGVGSGVGCQHVRLYDQTPHTITQCDTCHAASRDCCHSLITDLITRSLTVA